MVCGSKITIFLVCFQLVGMDCCGGGDGGSARGDGICVMVGFWIQ